MKFLIQFLVVLLLIITAVPAWPELEFNRQPKSVTLQDKLGGRLDGTPWSSAELKNKVSVLFYVDPDAKDLNNPASEALRVENFPLDKYQSFAVINMAATWLPNFAITSSLEEKQKIYQNTIYIRDYQKTLVKEWNIADDTSDVFVFDKAGRLLFRKEGQLSDEEIKILVKTVRDHLDK